MSSYTIHHPNILADTRQRKQLGSSNIAILLRVFFYKTIIPLVLVGYENNSALRASLTIYHLISDARSWNDLNIFIASLSRLND